MDRHDGHVLSAKGYHTILFSGKNEVSCGVKSTLDSCFRGKSGPDNGIRGFIAVTGDGERPVHEDPQARSTDTTWIQANAKIYATRPYLSFPG